MKKIQFTSVILAIVIIVAYAFNNHGHASIKGKILPVGAARSVIAFKNQDSVKANLINGTFSIPLDPGTYTLLIEAESPYHQVVLEKVMVKENELKDVGEIVLK